MPKAGFASLGHGTTRETEARQRLLGLFKSTPIPDEELLVNLGLYTRSLVVAKILYLDELYRRILPIPGVVVELGVWWGANLALFESLRSVHEPYNFSRKVVGFDTWEGYQSFSPRDGQSAHLEHTREGGYGVTPGYEEHLAAVLDAHEQDNVLPHLKKHELVKGNVMTTMEGYLVEHPETIVALAYFDLALYEPTRKCLELLRPRLVKGSVLAMDELNSADFPGETIALRETLGLSTYRIVRSQFLPDRSYLVVE